MKNRMGFGALVIAAILTGTGSAMSAGAVAVGQPAHVAEKGVSMGYNTNSKTVDEAKAKALAHCKTNGGVESKALCKIVATFSNQCVAEVLDPKAGTPGFGWAIADSAQEAQKQAMANCRKTAGPSRRDACQITPDTPTLCDGSAK